MPPPRWALRLVLVGRDATEALLSRLAAANRSVPARVSVFRLLQVHHVNVWRELRAATVPLLYLRGLRDRLVPARNGDAMAAAGVPVRDLDGPHLLLQTKPAEAARAIEEFVAGL